MCLDTAPISGCFFFPFCFSLEESNCCQTLCEYCVAVFHGTYVIIWCGEVNTILKAITGTLTAQRCLVRHFFRGVCCFGSAVERGGALECAASTTVVQSREKDEHQSSLREDGWAAGSWFSYRGRKDICVVDGVCSKDLLSGCASHPFPAAWE